MGSHGRHCPGIGWIMSHACFYCAVNELVIKCNDCENIFSCERHLKIHRPSDTCLPFTVITRGHIGRCAVASRNILAGEIVIEDNAAMIAPAAGHLVCLECFSPVSGDTKCGKCSLPLCCKGPRHKVECGLMAKWSGERTSSLYLSVAVLRLMAVGSKTWELVDSLMDHLEERKCEAGDVDWKKVDKNVIRYLKKGGVEQTEAALERAAGIILTNCVACRGIKGGPDSGIGLFPVFSILSHSCLANTRRIIEDDHLFVKAAVPIKAGEELLTSYKNPELGSVSRRSHFPTTWFFDCNCERCSDPTELGTFLSALICPLPDCTKTMLPSHPLEYNSPWVCEGCSFSISSNEAMTKTVNLFKMLVSCPKTCQSMEKLLLQLEYLAHPQHYIVMQTKITLALMYGDADHADQDSVMGNERKISLCEEVIMVMGKVDPGYGKRKGQLLEEMVKSKLAILKKKEISKLKLMLEMKNLMKLIREASKCKQFESKEEQESFAKRVEAMMGG